MTTTLLSYLNIQMIYANMFALVGFDEEGYPLEEDLWEEDEFGDDDLDDEDEDEDEDLDDEDEDEWE